MIKECLRSTIYLIKDLLPDQTNLQLIIDNLDPFVTTWNFSQLAKGIITSPILNLFSSLIPTKLGIIKVLASLIENLTIQIHTKL